MRVASTVLDLIVFLIYEQMSNYIGMYYVVGIQKTIFWLKQQSNG